MFREWKDGWMWFGEGWVEWIDVVWRVDGGRDWRMDGWMDVVWGMDGVDVFGNGWVDVIWRMMDGCGFGEWMDECGLENGWVMDDGWIGLENRWVDG